MTTTKKSSSIKVLLRHRDRALEDLEEAKRRYKEARIEAQTECPHPVSEIFEGHYPQESDMRPSEFRVCTGCGYAEDGWGCGYSFLGRGNYGSDIKKVSSDEALKYVRGKVIPNEDHSDVRLGRRTLDSVLRYDNLTTRI